MRKLQFNKGYTACGLTGRKWKVEDLRADALCPYSDIQFPAMGLLYSDSYWPTKKDFRIFRVVKISRNLLDFLRMPPQIKKNSRHWCFYFNNL